MTDLTIYQPQIYVQSEKSNENYLLQKENDLIQK